LENQAFSIGRPIRLGILAPMRQLVQVGDVLGGAQNR
jgi:hypothetical protein